MLRSQWALTACCFLFCFLLLLPGCGPSSILLSPPGDVTGSGDPIAGLIVTQPAAGETTTLETMQFSIQVGAFSEVQNAARFEKELEAKGLDAYYFRDSDNLYKVRFGNYAQYPAARGQAELLQRKGVIARFFVVIPESYPAAQIRRSGRGSLRDELVRTARKFIGVPYLWGGETQRGFDCSGLTLVCYRINGLNLPRNSRAQYDKGVKISMAQLQKGDLVFFATHGGNRVTHVGIYAGAGQFIHAPRTGKTVRLANLSSKYWSNAYVGGRSYL
ncbi:C40 family peptidase [Geopsychrobacter electrodiphilus]|uniref:C40 family peptidase n=1 Tax=Geopsychrobacter electrodiphilus TaxID=225196 RepID=UPI001FE04F0D|nr:NlpC/P60 family protein [Geopsychrobacter electrodiphilus]